MAVSYDKLWKLLIDKKMNKTQLCERAKSVLMLWRDSAGMKMYE